MTINHHLCSSQVLLSPRLLLWEGRASRVPAKDWKLPLGMQRQFCCVWWVSTREFFGVGLFGLVVLNATNYLFRKVFSSLTVKLLVYHPSFCDFFCKDTLCLQKAQLTNQLNAVSFLILPLTDISKQNCELQASTTFSENTPTTILVLSIYICWGTPVRQLPASPQLESNYKQEIGKW